MQTALYRAERPEVFEDIIGQKHIVRILQNQLKTDTVSQAYLFAGSHGTGKTSTARILAKAVNCTGGEENRPCGRCDNCEAIREGRFVDCIELDAASNNRVEDFRTIVDMVKYPPSVGRYKVYIIDEVHMLSGSAENAFLKTLEEPPEHAIFILATTDPQKVRATIRSRCMELNFKRVSEEDIIAGMKRICDKRNIKAADDALETIATRANGSVRDALSILEQCAAAGDDELNRSLVLEYTGAAGEDFYLALTDAVIAGDTSKALIYIDEIMKRGKDARQILKDWLGHFRDLMIIKYVSRPERIIGYSEENIERFKAQAASASLSFIESGIRLISEYINLGRYSEQPRVLLETAALRLSQPAGTGEAAVHAQPAAPAARGANAAAMASAASKAPARPVEQDKAEEPLSDLRDLMPEEDSQNAPAEAPTPEEAPTDEAASEESEYEPVGLPLEMWDRIVQEITATDRSFLTLVGHHSEATDFDDGELTVTVRPGKMKLAENKSADIARIARTIYGPDIIVTLVSGELENDKHKTHEMTEQETAEILQNDDTINEAAADIEELFGIKPVIED